MKPFFQRSALLILFALKASVGYSQDILWEKSFGGKHAEYLFDVQPTADNGFILAGSSLSGKTGLKTEANNGDLDYWVWKIDEEGKLEWQKNLGGAQTDILYSLKVTLDGGFILAGNSNSNKGGQKKNDCFGQEDFWIIKLDAKGNEEWQQTIGGSGQDELQTIIQTVDGGYLVGGSSTSGVSDNISTSADIKGKTEENFGSKDFWILKLNQDGKIEWQKTFGGTFSDVLKSVKQTSDGGYIAGGSSNSPESGNKIEKNYGKSDYWVLKLDKDGLLEWQRTYGGDGNDQLSVVELTSDGNIIIGGSSNSAATGIKDRMSKGKDFWLLKIDKNGQILWQEVYNIGKSDLLLSVIENEDQTLLLGGYAQSEVIGTKKSDNEGVNDYIAIKTSQNGEEVWRKVVGSKGDDVLRKVVELRDGGYLMAGTSNGKISRDKNSGIGGSDFWIVKLKDKQKPEKTPIVIEAIPNPTKQYTNIIVGYDYNKGTATLFDLAGRLLRQFEVNGRIIPVDLGNLPQGVYLVQIKTDKSTDSVKVIKN
jgi:hypothetical protein